MEIFSIIHKFQLRTAFHYHPDIHGPETGFPLHFENGLHFVLFLYFCTPYVLDHMGNVIILGVLQCKMPLSAICFFCLIFFCGGGGGEKFSIQSKTIFYLLSIYYALQTLKCPLD